MAIELPNFADEYTSWLTSRVTQQVRNGVVEISTPLTDSLNDGMRVYVDTSNHETLIHDGGLTLETLSLRGIDVSTQSRKKMVDGILRSTGAGLDAGERIYINANSTNISQRMHLLLMAMSRLNDLWMTAKSKNPMAGLFCDQVCDFLDSKNVLYSTDMTIPGKTVSHPIDIVIPLPKRRERLVRLIGTPSTNMAKIISFSWIEISEARPAADRIVIINDDTNESNGIGRNLSQQTETILRGYSTQIFRWSLRDEPSFSGLWFAA